MDEGVGMTNSRPRLWIVRRFRNFPSTVRHRSILHAWHALHTLTPPVWIPVGLLSGIPSRHIVLSPPRRNLHARSGIPVSLRGVDGIFTRLTRKISINIQWKSIFERSSNVGFVRADCALPAALRFVPTFQEWLSSNRSREGDGPIPRDKLPHTAMVLTYATFPLRLASEPRFVLRLGLVQQFGRISAVVAPFDSVAAQSGRLTSLRREERSIERWIGLIPAHGLVGSRRMDTRSHTDMDRSDS